MRIRIIHFIQHILQEQCTFFEKQLLPNTHTQPAHPPLVMLREQRRHTPHAQQWRQQRRRRHQTCTRFSERARAHARTHFTKGIYACERVCVCATTDLLEMTTFRRPRGRRQRRQHAADNGPYARIRASVARAGVRNNLCAP